jgi:hypothetical protein
MILLCRFGETRIEFLHRPIDDRDSTLQDETRKVSWPRLGILTIGAPEYAGELCSRTE